MFFSSDTNNLPREGELICIRGSEKHERPYRVLRRVLDTGTGYVMVDLIDATTGVQLPRCKVEPFSFWPSKGDQVLIVMGPYLDWLAAQLGAAKASMNRGLIKRIEARFRACEIAGKTTAELVQPHVLDLVEGTGVSAMGAVKRKGGQLFKCPLKCLAVLEKRDRRSDSRSVQEGQLNLLTTEKAA